MTTYQEPFHTMAVNSNITKKDVTLCVSGENDAILCTQSGNIVLQNCVLHIETPPDSFRNVHITTPSGTIRISRIKLHSAVLSAMDGDVVLEDVDGVDEVCVENGSACFDTAVVGRLFCGLGRDSCSSNKSEICAKSKGDDTRWSAILHNSTVETTVVAEGMLVSATLCKLGKCLGRYDRMQLSGTEVDEIEHVDFLDCAGGVVKKALTTSLVLRGNVFVDEIHVDVRNTRKLPENLVGFTKTPPGCRVSIGQGAVINTLCFVVDDSVQNTPEEGGRNIVVVSIDENVSIRDIRVLWNKDLQNDGKAKPSRVVRPSRVLRPPKPSAPLSDSLPSASEAIFSSRNNKRDGNAWFSNLIRSDTAKASSRFDKASSSASGEDCALKPRSDFSVRVKNDKIPTMTSKPLEADLLFLLPDLPPNGFGYINGHACRTENGERIRYVDSEETELPEVVVQFVLPNRPKSNYDSSSRIEHICFEKCRGTVLFDAPFVTCDQLTQECDISTRALETK